MPRAGRLPGLPLLRRDVSLSELGARAVSGAVLGIAALLLTWVGGWVFALFWLAAGIAVLVGWTEISRVAPRRPLQALMSAALAALLAVWLLRLPGWAGPAVAAS